MQKTVLICKQHRFGSPQLIRATVLSETKDTMRVIPIGQRKIVEVKASETRPVSAVFANRLATQQGRVIPKAYPDGSNHLGAILERRGF